MDAQIHLIEGKETDQEPAIFRIHNKKLGKSLLKPGTGPIESLTLGDSDVYLEERDDDEDIEWVLPHSKNFVDFINDHFGSDPKFRSTVGNFIKEIEEAMEKGSDSEPFPYQWFIYEMMRYGTPYRGILLEHGLGSGKTRTCIMVAESFRREGLPVLIMTPAGLKHNFLSEIMRWGDDDIRVLDSMGPSEKARRMRTISKAYHFVSYNATGKGLTKTDKQTNQSVAGKDSVYEQLARLGIGFPVGSDYEKKFPYLTKKYGNLKPPEKMLIIIEEMHGLNRSFKKGPNTLRFYLYPLLMMATDCKIIGLTGTPMVNSLFEMATLYNVLRGPLPGNRRALPESEAQFNQTFVNYQKMPPQLTRENVLMSRIIGLTSYFRGITDDPDRKIYPHNAGNEIVTLHMSDYQSGIHDLIMDDELSSKKIRRRKLSDLTGLATGVIMSQEQAELEPPAQYHMGSRQASNFVFPEDIPRPRKGRVQRQDAWDTMKDYVFQFQYKGKTPQSCQELQLVWEHFVGSRVTVTEFADDYQTAKDENDLEECRRILSVLVRNAYETAPPVKAQHPLIKAKLLSPRDRSMVKKHLGEYNDRLLESLNEIAENSDKYLTLRALREKYSIKMEKIYKTIISDIDNGASYVNYDQKDQKLEIEEEEQELSSIDHIDLGDEGEESEIEVLRNMNRAKVINDPEDPFKEKRFQDVYLPDDEIEGTVVGGPALVYSFFNTVEGAGIFSKILEAHGFTEFTDDVCKITDDPATIKRAPRYAFIKGGMDNEIGGYRDKVMKVFNSKANTHGQIIRIIFATNAASEGISLFHLRQIHIMEPDWENTTIDQVIGRGFRLRSHRYLPFDERQIKIFHYFAQSNQYEDEAADYIVKKTADRKTALLDQAKPIRHRTAADCAINSDYNKLEDECFNFEASDRSGPAFANSYEHAVSQTTNIKTKEKQEATVVLRTPQGHKILYFVNEPMVNIEVSKVDGQGNTRKGIYEAYVVYKNTTDKGVVSSKGLVKIGYYVPSPLPNKQGKYVPLDRRNIREI